MPLIDPKTAEDVYNDSSWAARRKEAREWRDARSLGKRIASKRCAYRGNQSDGMIARNQSGATSANSLSAWSPAAADAVGALGRVGIGS